MIIVTIVAFLIVLALAVTTLTWIHDLERKDCSCARDANHRMIKHIGYYIIAMVVVSAALSISRDAKTIPLPIINSIMMILGIFNFVVTITFIVVGFKYIRGLEEKKCACALDDPRRHVFQTWIWLYIAMYALAAILFVFYAIVIVRLMMSIRKITKKYKN